MNTSSAQCKVEDEYILGLKRYGTGDETEKNMENKDLDFAESSSDVNSGRDVARRYIIVQPSSSQRLYNKELIGVTGDSGISPVSFTKTSQLQHCAMIV